MDGTRSSLYSFLGTTGGGSAAAVTPTSLAQVVSVLSDTTTRVINLDRVRHAVVRHKHLRYSHSALAFPGLGLHQLLRHGQQAVLQAMDVQPQPAVLAQLGQWLWHAVSDRPFYPPSRINSSLRHFSPFQNPLQRYLLQVWLRDQSRG